MFTNTYLWHGQSYPHSHTVPFFFREKRLSPGKPSKQAMPVQSFSNCAVMKFNTLTETFRVWDVALRAFAFFLLCIARSELGVIFLERPHLVFLGFANLLDHFSLVNDFSLCSFCEMNNCMMWYVRCCCSSKVVITSFWDPEREGMVFPYVSISTTFQLKDNILFFPHEYRT